MAKNISFKQLRHMWPAYLLVLPSAALVATFAYFPAAQGIIKSFFEWDGQQVDNFIGLDNYRRVLGSLAHVGALLAVVLPFLAARAAKARGIIISHLLMLALVVFVGFALRADAGSPYASMEWLKVPAPAPAGMMANIGEGSATGLLKTIMVLYMLASLTGLGFTLAKRQKLAKSMFYATFALSAVGLYVACLLGFLNTPAVTWVIIMSLLAVLGANLVAKGRDLPLARAMLLVLSITILAGMALVDSAKLISLLEVQSPSGSFAAVALKMPFALSPWNYVLIGSALALGGYAASWAVPPVTTYTPTFAQRLVAGLQKFGLALALIAMLFGLWRMARTDKLPGDPLLWKGFGLTGILLVFNLLKMIPSIVTAVIIHRLFSQRWQYLYRVLFVVPMIIPGIVQLLIWRFMFDARGPLNQILNAAGIMNHLSAFGIAGFESSHPSWLGNPDLVIPALIIWGFPWIGVVGVLIYLAGLQNIGTEVYESANLDGAGSLRKFWSIEMPLVSTQVRLMLILMTIGTIQDFSSFLVLLGPEGGPRGVALVPALYMFRNAFVNPEPSLGYACAIGIILFFIILTMTMINNKYVRVDK